MHCLSLGLNPKLFKLKKEYVNILFIIPIIETIQGHMLEIYNMVSQMHNNVHLVVDVKNC